MRQYIKKSLFPLLAASILTILLVGWAFFNFYIILQLGLPQTTFILVNTRIILIMLFVLFLIFCIFIALGILTYITIHRILGPIPRLEKELRRMLETGEIHSLFVRREDILKNIIDMINELLIKKK